jgi:hypothetical protein
MDWGFRLCFAPPTSGDVDKLHYVEISSQVLCPARRPVTIFDFGLGPEINFRACPWVLIRPRHIAIGWLFNEPFIFFLIICLETPKAGSGPTNWLTVPSIASSLAISFPCIPECPRTQNSLTEWRVECHSTHFGTVVPMCQWGQYFGSLKGFQSRLTVIANTNVFLWSNVHTNFTCTGQDSIHLDLETVAYFPTEILSLLPEDCP